MLPFEVDAIRRVPEEFGVPVVGMGRVDEEGVFGGMWPASEEVACTRELVAEGPARANEEGSGCSRKAAPAPALGDCALFAFGCAFWRTSRIAFCKCCRVGNTSLCFS